MQLWGHAFRSNLWIILSCWMALKLIGSTLLRSPSAKNASTPKGGGEGSGAFKSGSFKKKHAHPVHRPLTLSSASRLHCQSSKTGETRHQSHTVRQPPIGVRPVVGFCWMKSKTSRPAVVPNDNALLEVILPVICLNTARSLRDISVHVVVIGLIWVKLGMKYGFDEVAVGEGHSRSFLLTRLALGWSAC